MSRQLQSEASQAPDSCRYDVQPAWHSYRMVLQPCTWAFRYAHPADSAIFSSSMQQVQAKINMSLLDTILSRAGPNASRSYLERWKASYV